MEENWIWFFIHQSPECPMSTIFTKTTASWIFPKDWMDSMWYLWSLVNRSAQMYSPIKNFVATVLTITRHKYNDYGFSNHSSLRIRFWLLSLSQESKMYKKIYAERKNMYKKSLFRMWHYYNGLISIDTHSNDQLIKSKVNFCEVVNMHPRWLMVSGCCLLKWNERTLPHQSHSVCTLVRVFVCQWLGQWNRWWTMAYLEPLFFI